MKNKKKNIVIIAAIAVFFIVFESWAYFTDTETITNSFTVGSVEIKLCEENWEKLEDLNKNDIPDIAENIVPNKKIPKDPKIQNVGSNPAWVYLEVSIPCYEILTANSDGMKQEIAPTELFIFNSNKDWQLLDKKSSENKVVYIYGYGNSLSPDSITPTLFDYVTFCNMLEGQNLEKTVQNIDIKAMAIQSEEIVSLEEGYTKYFNQNMSSVENGAKDDYITEK